MWRFAVRTRVMKFDYISYRRQDRVSTSFPVQKVPRMLLMLTNLHNTLSFPLLRLWLGVSTYTKAAIIIRAFPCRPADAVDPETSLKQLSKSSKIAQSITLVWFSI